MPTATRLLITALCCALACNAANAQAPKSTRAQTIERVVHVAPPSANGSRYAYVPFDVPRGAVRVSVSYDYAREGGANTLDLGVFDARFDGSDTDPRGFRGWSGGRRSGFLISRDEATPGYLPGQLPAGTWCVILGLYKVAPAGVDVSFKIVVETEEVGTGRAATLTRRADSPSAVEMNATGDAEGARRPPSTVQQSAGRGMRWWSGDLHMHTVHSDGDWTVPGLADAARDVGLDFIFITDHNTSSHHAEIARVAQDSRRPLVLRGEEITTYGGHTNAWGLPAGGWVDFRVQPGDANGMAEVAARAHRLGALISINHPYALCGGCAWSYGEALKYFDAIEVWNGDWDATDESALKMWDEALQRGLRPTAVGSSDSHRPQNPIGRPATHVAAEALTQAALLNGIRRGRVYLTRAARDIPLEFDARTGEIHLRSSWGARREIGEEISLRAPGHVVFFVYVGESVGTVSVVSDGRVIRTFKGRPLGLTEVFEVECERDGYYRLEVRDTDGRMFALTNPIFVKVRAGR